MRDKALVAEAPDSAPGDPQIAPPAAPAIRMRLARSAGGDRFPRWRSLGSSTCSARRSRRAAAALAHGPGAGDDDDDRYPGRDPRRGYAWSWSMGSRPGWSGVDREPPRVSSSRLAPPRSAWLGARRGQPGRRDRHRAARLGRQPPRGARHRRCDPRCGGGQRKDPCDPDLVPRSTATSSPRSTAPAGWPLLANALA